MSRRIALGLAYSGTPWRGWQRQPHRQTVQNEVESAASLFLNDAVTVTAAGRTDAGVHALGQVIHLDTEASRPDRSWVRGLNSYLPSSIAVQWAQEVSPEFHAQFSATVRTYVYIVRNAPVRSPLTDSRTGWVFQPLDLQVMQQAAQYLIGEHDFSSFRSSDCQATSPVRCLYTAEVESHQQFFYFIFTANGFLHHMVRNLVGMLLYIGQGRRPVDWPELLLRQKDRTLSAPTFSPHGLYLADVGYPEHFQIPTEPWRKRLASHIGLGLLTGMQQ